MIQSRMQSLFPNALVEELIDKQTTWWNVQLVQLVFTKADFAAIFHILVRSHDGIFTVKSAYHLYMEKLCSSPGESFHRTEYNSCWKELWALNIASVVKNFLWRACSKPLPTKLNLYKRSITGRDLAYFGHVAIALWHRKNSLIFEQKFTHPSVLFQHAVTDCDAYQQAMEAISQQTSTAPNATVKWEFPPHGHIKINLDIAARKHVNRIGTGIVLRDWEGDVLLTLMKPMFFCSYPNLAETRGLLEAVKLCRTPVYF
ncbi:hypothetical protein CIPAW_15G048300 [Carya illinoinensis]|uniref:RNase H type-1 domain-containing protein n=1 Tax=Carya illinoinensis TaxID=32201 RepID=A0A8T1N9D1_CARIL|nr:hypothetical protein CIPAW_15G048300 [Carya illinoinensis]